MPSRFSVSHLFLVIWIDSVESRLRQKANVRCNETISQNRKWADKHYPKYFFWMKLSKGNTLRGTNWRLQFANVIINFLIVTIFAVVASQIWTFYQLNTTRLVARCIFHGFKYTNLHNKRAVLNIHGELICVPTKIGWSSVGVNWTKKTKPVHDKEKTI